MNNVVRTGITIFNGNDEPKETFEKVKGHTLRRSESTDCVISLYLGTSERSLSYVACMEQTQHRQNTGKTLDFLGVVPPNSVCLAAELCTCATELSVVLIDLQRPKSSHPGMMSQTHLVE